MPVQPVISLEQIVIIVAFLMLLLALMWMIKRNRGGISSRLHPARRMQHLEDLSLAPQQRLHLIEVDGRTFLVHAGKGHAASFIAVDGDAGEGGQNAPSGQAASKAARPSPGPASGKTAKAKPAAPAAPKNAFAAAIAAARRNNPSLGFGK